MRPRNASARVVRPCSIAAVAAASVAVAAGARPQSGVDFERDVRPILEGRCTACHGALVQKGDLRFDRQPDALASGVIIAGDPSASEVVRRVLASDEDERMPFGEPALDAREIETLSAWIASGAPWPDDAGPLHTPPSTHWAYQPPRRPSVPEVRDASWVRNPLDAFVLARIEREGLSPSPEADRATLLRRVSLDLTGLPPSIEELDEFLADGSPDAYEREVERLLASPHYGERMARVWLDLARYADSQGYEKDQRRTMWRYRDWVIDAFRAHMPFDRFTLLQIAGDLLPDATLEDRIATGFHRNTMLNEEGGTDPEEFRVDAVVDRVNTTATVWLGTTLACAQCHDHKYDPFPQRDYYRLFACFDSTADGGRESEPTIRAPTRAQASELERIERELGDSEARFEAAGADLDREQPVWEREAARALAAPTEWHVLRPAEASALPPGPALAVRDDGSILASGPTPERVSYDLILVPPAMRARVLRIEAIPDAGLPSGGPGRAGNGNFVLSSVRAVRVGSSSAADRLPVELTAAQADVEQANGPHRAADALDGDPDSGWAVDGFAHDRPHVALFALDPPLELDGQATLRITLAHDSKYAQHALGCFRISLADDIAIARALAQSAADPAAAAWRREVLFDGEVARALRLPLSERDEAATSTLRDHFRRVASARGRELWTDVERLRAERERVQQSFPTALVMRELETPRETHVHTKGNFLAPGERVAPGLPALFGGANFAGEPPRLALARWLTSRDNPLTARVTVNRLWELFIGRALVATAQDFGTRGDRPSHPELLDWLAVELMDRGWSLEELIREIVTSSTYRQSSACAPELRARDPENELIARAARHRVEVETLRDVALAASGLLVREIGGPSAFPPQPDGIWNSAYSGDRWPTDSGSQRFRRGLYTFWKRTAPYPTFQLFEAPSREVCCTRRASTNTPLQALALLNDPAFVEAAVALARRMLAEAGPDDEARVEHGFRLCTARFPAAEERAVLLALCAAERADLGADSELAAWTAVASALLNLDETLTRN